MNSPMKLSTKQVAVAADVLPTANDREQKGDRKGEPDEDRVSEAERRGKLLRPAEQADCLRQEHAHHEGQLPGRLVLTEGVGRDDATLLHGDGAEPGDKELATDDDRRCPSGNDLQLGVSDERRRHENLVSQGIEKLPEVRGLIPRTRDCAVQPIGHSHRHSQHKGGDHEDSTHHRVARPEQDQQKKQWYRRDAAQAEKIGEV